MDEPTRGATVMDELMDELMDGFDRRSKRAKAATEMMTGAEDLASKLGKADFLLNPEAGRLVARAFADVAQQGKRALQDCYWSEGEVKHAIESLHAEATELTEQRDELANQVEIQEGHFNRLAAFVNWTTSQGLTSVNPTEVISGLHESCPPDPADTHLNF